ncbi:unnamed protein product [Lactuca saligna]|uniref:Protein kinase domain-containing protein n=1 Tax=Lactuca saligna TaxID=75948 RepID=A0AA35YFA8_LACSI|nr:unnamed protein product [Lactuca saligna]
MEGQSSSQKVVLVHDASGGVRMNAVSWILDGFELKDGDMFVFLSVLHQIHHPMGYKIRVDSSMFGGANQKAIDEEVARKKKEHEDNLELVQLSTLYEMQKINFKIELVTGPIPKKAAVEAIKKFDATWIILDRRMKRDRKYFLEKLSCGISRMKHNDDIIKIRGPKLSMAQSPRMPLSYGDMLPVDHKISTKQPQNDEDLFSIEFDSSHASSASTRTSISDGLLSIGNNNDDKVQLSTLLEAFGEEQEQEKSPQIETLPIVQVDQKKCTTCNSTRPTSLWKTRNFLYSELIDATNRFSSETLIYRGENEAVFYGTLKDTKLNVIVKEQKDVRKYKSEMQALEKTRNENVIMLLGTCLEKNVRLLVFEFACNGSLDQHLSHQSARPLTWGERIKIAIGASKGLCHLHENNIIHGDVRPKNIFLTHDFEPLIAGFGLARMEKEPQNDHFIIGTFGYVAPEYTERGKATRKTDVFAFGIVLLELITGRSPTDTRLKGQNFLNWAIPLVMERKFSHLIDPGIAYHNDQFMSIVQLAVNCICDDPHIRLPMDEVAFTLDYIKGDEIQRSDEIEEVNNGNVETITGYGQGQLRTPYKKVNFYFGGMTPVPKQAKHFYQVGQL